MDNNYLPPLRGNDYPPNGHLQSLIITSEQQLAEWSKVRSYTLNLQPNLEWYQAWRPFVFNCPIARVSREVSATFNEAQVWVAETFEEDALKSSLGEDRHIVAFIISPKLTYRAAFRSRQRQGVIDSIGKELNSIFSNNKPRSLLNDPNFESHFEVQAPTHEEAHRAIPIALRQSVLQSNWQGIVEIRTGGMLCETFQLNRFEPNTLDFVFSTVGQLYNLATQYPHAATTPL